jgi:predicted DNA-binding protein (MmcQ/YjbR family)
MTIKELIDYSISKKGAEYEYKPEWKADIVKVNGKMFAFAGEDKAGNKIINLKNDPEINLKLRKAFPNFVSAGYYSNKARCNSWFYDKKGVKDNLLKE